MFVLEIWEVLRLNDVSDRNYFRPKFWTEIRSRLYKIRSHVDRFPSGWRNFRSIYFKIRSCSDRFPSIGRKFRSGSYKIRSYFDRFPSSRPKVPSRLDIIRSYFDRFPSSWQKVPSIFGQVVIESGLVSIQSRPFWRILIFQNTPSKPIQTRHEPTGHHPYRPMQNYPLAVDFHIDLTGVITGHYHANCSAPPWNIFGGLSLVKILCAVRSRWSVWDGQPKNITTYDLVFKSIVIF